MSLSGFIEKNYSGNLEGYRFECDKNLPSTPIGTGCVMYAYYSTAMYGTVGTAAQIGTPRTSSSGHTALEAFTPRQVYSLDKKIDDGLASNGTLYAVRGGNYENQAGKCVNADYDDPSANYELGDTDITCRIFYWYKKE